MNFYDIKINMESCSSIFISFIISVSFALQTVWLEFVHGFLIDSIFPVFVLCLLTMIPQTLGEMTVLVQSGIDSTQALSCVV